ncbi:alpha-L-fucosidase [Aliidiomarina shirensis]|uniref:Alpha-L-fucosidase n=1 Tax=Aliidiomarina shirensis TaxID=1048642 RepID=A0A432WQW9_9GAMM|nr:amidoligase family protein [Aliidiomarina shirensis]RUO36158.1 alpha-L-fucosidase [Aliidiomarina shirensis]
MSDVNSLVKPPAAQTSNNEERRVGIEIEFSGLKLQEATNVLLKYLEKNCDKCEQSEKGRYEHVISGDSAGDWIIEFDYDYLKKIGRESEYNDWRDSAEKGLAWIAESVVPIEVVSPPLPLHRLPEVESLIDELREAGAKGSSDSIAYAFGMQLNPELPDLEADTICAHIKSFLCLYDWLLKKIDPDISRRISNYIDPFPKAYLELVLKSNYWPSREQLIDDYLQHNPTRNRALDMLPLFRHIDEERVLNTVNDKLIKSRPTFHYRLPGSEIHRPNWGLFSVWNDWVRVEQLADNRELLNKVSEEYLSEIKKLFSGFNDDWQHYIANTIIPGLTDGEEQIN